MISLGEIAKWEKGSFLPLEMSCCDDVTLICGDVPLLKGCMGRKSDHVVIKVKDKADRNG